MTFDAKEKSRALGSPISLFLIRYGKAANNYYAYTNAEQETRFSGIDFKPVAVDHDDIVRGLTLDNTQQTLSLPGNVPLATRFRSYPPSEVISLTIWQGHTDDVEFKVAWLGRILSHKDLEDGDAEFTCEPRTTSLSRPGLSRNWQYGCPLMLYSQGSRRCNANKAAATQTFTVNQVDGPLIRLDGVTAATAAMLDYETGLIEWTTADLRVEVRSIQRIDEDGTLILGGTALELNAGMSVKLSKGCNHVVFAPEGDCERIHNNVVNYGGQIYIPTSNPIGIKNIFN